MASSQNHVRLEDEATKQTSDNLRNCLVNSAHEFHKTLENLHNFYLYFYFLVSLQGPKFRITFLNLHSL